MTWLGVGSASSRRTTMGILVAGLMWTAASVQAQEAPAPAPSQPQPEAQAPAPPQDDPFKFKSDAAIIFWSVKPEQTAAFERVWSTIRARLEGAERPDLKALGQSIKIVRPEGPPTPQGVPYFFIIDPVSKTLTYQPSPFLLFQTGLFEDAEARQLYEQLMASVNGINPTPVTPVALPADAPPPPPPAAPAEAPAPPAPAAP
jgi:hypothetical protein